MNFLTDIDLKSKFPVQAHGILEQVQDILPVVFGVVYYPLWLVCALLYGLSPFKMPFESFFDEIAVKSDSYTHFKSVRDGKVDEGGDAVVPLSQFAHAHKESMEDKSDDKVPGRDQIIKSLLKIASLDRTHITEVVRGENEMFADDLKFTDHIVSYLDRKEWITSFHALTVMMSAKIVEIESIRHDAELSVVQFRMCWMTPFSFINELVGGMEFSNVMVVRFDESDRVCQIDEYWNGRDHLNAMGLVGVMRRMTAWVTLPLCQITSCFAK